MSLHALPSCLNKCFELPRVKERPGRELDLEAKQRVPFNVAGLNSVLCENIHRFQRVSMKKNLQIFYFY